MTTNTTGVEVEKKVVPPEPRTLPGIASEVITAILAGVGVVIAVYSVANAIASHGDGLLLHSAAALVGVLMLFRFTRDDLRWTSYILEAAYTQTRNVVLKQKIKGLEKKLEDAQRPIIHVSHHNYTKAVEPEPSWLDARLLILTSHKGKIPGRNRSNLTQQRQTEALAMMARANLIKLVGRQYELTMSKEDASKRLDEMIRQSI